MKIESTVNEEASGDGEIIKHQNRGDFSEGCTGSGLMLKMKFEELIKIGWALEHTQSMRLNRECKNSNIIYHIINK
jgi:hypothetical protein